jgi:multisubunit Na+/H+ antiporter MnhB subunit
MKSFILNDTRQTSVGDVAVFVCAVALILLQLAFDWPLRTLMGADWARHKCGYRLLTLALIGVIVCWISVLTLGKANIVGAVSLTIAFISAFSALFVGVVNMLNGEPPVSMTTRKEN